LIEPLNQGCWLARGKYFAPMLMTLAKKDGLITQFDVMDA